MSGWGEHCLRLQREKSSSFCSNPGSTAGLKRQLPVASWLNYHLLLGGEQVSGLLREQLTGRLSDASSSAGKSVKDEF